MKTILASFILVLLSTSTLMAQGVDDLFDSSVKTNTVTLALPEPCSATVNVEKVKEDIRFNIYPNPSGGLIYLNIGSESKLSNASLVVIDVMGKKVFEVKNLEKIFVPNYPVDLSRLADGIYFISASIEDKKATHKLIINKASKL